MTRSSWFSRNTIILLLALNIAISMVMVVQVHSDEVRKTRTNEARISAPSRLSLEQAISLALENNPRIQAQKADKEASRHQMDLAKSRFLPRLDLKSNYSYSNNPVNVFSSKLAQEDFSQEDFAIGTLNHPSGRGNMQSAIVLTQPIFNRGQELYGYESAKLGSEMVSAVAEQVRQAVLLQVRKAYLKWLLAIKSHEVISMAVQTAKANLRIVKSRYRAGNALKSDLLQAQVHLATLRKEETAFRNDKAITLSSLNLAMGLPPQQPWQPVYPAFSKPTNIPDVNHWTALALVHRPEETFYDLNTKMLEWKIKKAKMNFLPAINLKGMYEHNSENLVGSGGDAYTVMGSIDLNLFEGLGNMAELKKAKAEHAKAQAVREEVEQQIKHQVQRAWLHLQTARMQVEVTRQAIDQARESLRIIEKRYRNGLTIITELLDTETSLKRAKLQHLRATYDEQLALAELQWAAGVLDKPIE